MGRPAAGRASDGVRTIDDLARRCRVDEITDCWMWQQATRNGSALVWLPALHTAVGMGYALYYLTRGKAPERGVRYVPVCGRALCGNPAHRRLGDCSSLQMLVRPKLSPEHRARITVSSRRAKGSAYTPELARAVRAATGTLAEIAAAHGLSRDVVVNVRLGRGWQDVLPASSVWSWAGPK